MSDEQLGHLATYLKNRIHSFLPRDPELRLAVNRAIDAGLKDFYAKQRLEAYEGVDIGKLAEEFAALVPELKAQADRLKDIVPGIDDLTETGEVLKDVVVGQFHRVTLSEFPAGVSLRRIHLKRRDGSVGGITLIRRR